VFTDPIGNAAIHHLMLYYTLNAGNKVATCKP